MLGLSLIVITGLIHHFNFEDNNYIITNDSGDIFRRGSAYDMTNFLDSSTVISKLFTHYPASYALEYFVAVTAIFLIIFSLVRKPLIK
jgi:hypothetical protein